MSAPSPDPAPCTPELIGGSVHYLYGDLEPLTDCAVHDHVAHVSAYGPRPACHDRRGLHLIEAIDAARLSGRGGARFDVATKWRTVLSARAARGVRSVVVANGAEGDPLSRKDAALLTLRPHLVLDGLSCAADALGADEAVLWVHDDAHPVRMAATRALAERAGTDAVAIRLECGPANYLTGQTSVIVNALSGRAALPTLTREPAAVSGIDGRPTLVQNVDTFARIALLARGMREPDELVTVAGSRQLTVLEATPTTTLAEVVHRATGMSAPDAALLGGHSGRYVRWSEVCELPVGADVLRAHGVSLGMGSIALVAHGSCPLRHAADTTHFLSDASARQCGPCMFGLRAIADTMTELANASAHRRDTRRLQRWIAEVNGRGACHHPDSATTVVGSALTTFAGEVAAHLRGRCTYGARHA